MKLGLRTDLSISELEKAKRPSDLYNALTKSRLVSKDYSEVFLARFVYALEILGHRRHGFRAVRKLEDSVLKKPTKYSPIGNEDEVREFYFFQCLVEICVHLDSKHHRPLSTYCTKMHLRGINPAQFKTPAQLLTRLFQETIIKVDDQEMLVEGLEIIRADKCIEHIHRYRHLNKLPEMTGSRSTMSYQLSHDIGGTIKSTSSSTTEGELTLLRHTHRKISSRDRAVSRLPLEESLRSNQTDESSLESTLRHSQTAQQSEHQQSRNTQPDRQEGIQLESLARNEDMRDHLETEPIQTRQEDSHETDGVKNMKTLRNKKLICFWCASIWCFWITLLVLLVTTCAIAYGVEWSRGNKATTVKCYENSTVILTEIHHLFTSSLNVAEDTQHIGDFYRDVEIYQLNSRCDKLPTRTENFTFTNKSDISLINGTTFYALAGSSIKFSICAATTNYTIGEVERLELVLNRDTESQPADIKFFHVGTDGVWQCMDSTLQLKEPGYYTINFLPLTHEASFLFNATYNVCEIDAKQLQRRARKNHTLQRDQDLFKFSFDSVRYTYSCFAATIKDNPRTLKHTVHIQLEFTYHITLLIVGVVLIVLSLILIILVSILCAYLVKKK